MNCVTVKKKKATSKVGLKDSVQCPGGGGGGGGALPYKGLTGTCGPTGYGFQDFWFERGIYFAPFCFKRGIFT